MLKTYQTILFDADNTLLDFTRSEQEALSDMLTEFGFPCTEEIFQTYSEINSSCWRALEKGEMTRDVLKTQRFIRFLKQFGWNVDPDQMAKSYISHLGTKRFLIEGAEEICATLSRTYQLYLITNGTSSVQHSRFDPSPLRKYFSKCYISEEMGVEKPSKQFFDLVMADIGVLEKDRVLVVGDSLTSDMQGGVNAGLDICWYNPFGKLNHSGLSLTYEIRDLRELLMIL